MDSRLVDLEAILGHRFSNASLLERAVTHSSMVADAAIQSVPADNEQLEFLGDAVISLLVSEKLLEVFPGWPEGRLSRARARLVNSGSLAHAAGKLDLGRYLRLGPGEEKTGGRRKPALLADMFEALLGALYLDGGIEPARAFVVTALLKPALNAEGETLGRADHKSELQELLQKSGLPAAQYNVIEESGPDHHKTFLVEVSIAGGFKARGSGSNKKESEQLAARQALEQLRSVHGDAQ
jgi:ribonuclease-3